MITNKLLKVARAIAEYEGWEFYGADTSSAISGTKSWRNHNPGNLKASPFAVGSMGGFSVFINDEIGFFALVWDLWKKARGETQTKLKGSSTIYDLIKIYSAEPEDIVIKYARFIEQRTGILMTTKLEELIK